MFFTFAGALLSIKILPKASRLHLSDNLQFINLQPPNYPLTFQNLLFVYCH
jgi:hypothetical protein